MAALANQWALDGEWDFPALTKIPQSCFQSHSEVESRAATARISVRATNAVEIGANAFNWNWNITNAVFSQRLTTISPYAFDCCCKLRSFAPFLPDGVTAIGDFAFAWCDALATPLVSKSPKPLTVGKNAFDNTYGIPSFYIKTPISSIANSGFNCLMPGARIRMNGAPPAVLGSNWISTYNWASPFAVLLVDAASYPAWLDLITCPVGSETFEKSYRNRADFPGHRTLGVLSANGAGTVWVVQSVNEGLKLFMR